MFQNSFVRLMRYFYYSLENILNLNAEYENFLSIHFVFYHFIFYRIFIGIRWWINKIFKRFFHHFFGKIPSKLFSIGSNLSDKRWIVGVKKLFDFSSSGNKHIRILHLKRLSHPSSNLCATSVRKRDMKRRGMESKKSRRNKIKWNEKIIQKAGGKYAFGAF